MSHSQSLHIEGNKVKQGDVMRPSDDVIKLSYGNNFTLEEEDLPIFDQDYIQRL